MYNKKPNHLLEAPHNGTFAEKLQYCLDYSGTTKTKLSRVLGVTRMQIHRYCKEGALPEYLKLKKMARYFNVGWKWLVEDDPRREKYQIAFDDPEYY